MKHLKHLLKQPLSTPPTSLIVFLLVVALFGFVDASYITIEHFRGVIPPCTLISGCEKVITSPYSLIAGIPVSLLGSIYYLVILIGVFSFFESKNTKFLKLALLMTVFGMLFSAWFLYVQAFIIHAYCLYCLGSALASTTLFITACIVVRKYSIKNEVSF